MRIPLTRLLTVATVCAAAVGTLSGVASAAAGSGTYTTITTPSADVHFVFDGAPGATNTFPVSGTTSLDVTQVDIDCLYVQGGSPSVQTLASAVPVTGGSFSVTANMANIVLNCHLRAIPTGESTTGYVSSYAGPVLYTDTLIQASDATPTVYGLTAVGEEGDGIVVMRDAGTCGVQTIATVTAPSMTLGAVSNNCALGLPSGNDPSGSSTKSSVLVNGHNAYLPGAVSSYLIGSLGLAVTQPALTTSKVIASNGDITVTESAPLMRCSVGDTYPPTAGSCPQLIATGVTFKRVTAFFRAGHQVRVRDTFTSTDGLAHPIALEYQNHVVPGATGKPGYRFPAHPSTFAPSALDQTLTGFGTTAGTVLVRSDIYAASNDPAADTLGVSWSRPPSVVAFGHSNADAFLMRYALSVPASGVAFLGFAESETLQTTSTQALATLGIADMVNAPTITSPAAAAKVPTLATTVKGALTAGANGLPTSVVVNGHPATITKTSATTATYAVTFNEAWGSHLIAVTAKDAVGNTSLKKITVTNTPALVFNGAAHLSGSTMTVPLACKTWSAGTCSGKLVIKNTSGTTIGTAVFTVAKGGTKTVSVHLSPVTHSVKAYLYQREPNGSYPLAASKAFTI